MIPARLLAAALAVALSAACAATRSRRPQAPVADPTVTARWYAALHALGDSAALERGSAAVQPAASIPGAVAPVSGLLAFVSVRRLPPGTRLQWRVQQGACGARGLALGSPGAYPAMRVGADGSTEAQAALAAASIDGAHAVSVSDSTDRVLACGELRLVR